MCSQLKETDVLLTLVSGGGSALLAQPIDLTGTGDDRANLALELATIKSLVKKGADINELNTVTKNLNFFFLFKTSQVIFYSFLDEFYFKLN